LSSWPPAPAWGFGERAGKGRIGSRAPLGGSEGAGRTNGEACARGAPLGLVLAAFLLADAAPGGWFARLPFGGRIPGLGNTR